jgi:hypothetical protein
MMLKAGAGSLSTAAAWHVSGIAFAGHVVRSGSVVVLLLLTTWMMEMG